MGLQRFPFSDYRGGVNTRSGPFDLETNEAQDALNMSLTFRGALFERAGKVRIDNTLAAGKRAENIRSWYPPGLGPFLMCSVDGTVYSMTTAGAFTSRFAGTAAKHWCFEQATDGSGNVRLWMMNGTDAAQKWDGSAAGTSAWAGTPPNGTMIRNWKNRMIVAGVAATPQRLFYSDIGNPESFPAANTLDIKQTEDDVDPITWLDVVGDVLIVFKRRSVWMVMGSALSTTRRLGSPGCEDRFQSSGEIDGRLYFFSRTGVFSVTQNEQPVEESANIQPWFSTNINFAALDKARVYGTRDRRVFAAVPTGGSATNNRLIELDSWLRPYTSRKRGIDRGGFGPPAVMFHDLPVASMATFRTANTDRIVAAAANIERIHALFEGTNDDGAAISAYWQSGWQKFLAEEPYERVRRLNVELSGQCQVDLYTDFSPASKFSASLIADVDPDSLWDGGVWDGGIWDPNPSTSLERVRPEVRGRYHSIKFSNTVLDKTFTVYATEFAIRGGKEH